MLITDLTVEVRDSSLTRVGQLLPADLVGSEFVLRFNNVGGWKVTLPSSHPMADALRAPGAGLILTNSAGAVLLSGPTVSARNTKTATDPTGEWEIVGTDDSGVLGRMLAFPDPTTDDVTAQGADYDVRTGFAETVMKEFVDVNIGPSAVAGRQVPSLTIDTDLGRGATVTGKARFDRLGELLASLATTAGLGFTVDQQDDQLVFSVYEPADRSDYVRMDVDNQRLEKAEYAYKAPSVTRVIVAGQGAGVDRQFLEVANTESLAAETAWGQRIELFKDQRNTNDPDELTQAGDEVLADGGRTGESVSVSPSDDQTMAYGVDWGLGDRVTVVVGDTEVAQVVTEVAIVVTDAGVKVGATVGDPVVASASDPESVTAVATADQETRISNLERNEPSASGGGTSGPVAWTDVTGKPTTFTPSAHASSHGSGGADAITVAQSQVTGLSTALAGKVDTTDTRLTDTRTPTAHVHSAADVTSGTLAVARGGTGAGTADTARANLSAVGVYSQGTEPAGGNIGDVWVDTSSNVQAWSSFMPYAMAAGNVTVTGAGGTTASATITFPSGRFAVAPVVTANFAQGSIYIANANGISATGFTLVLRDRNDTAISGSFSSQWSAIQMTPTTADG